MDTPVTRIEFETLKETVRSIVEAQNNKIDIIIQKLNNIEANSAIPNFRGYADRNSFRNGLGENEATHGEDMIEMQEIIQKDGKG